VVSVSGGAIESIAERVAATGTTVVVSDLFFNTPARKKFLKSDAAEYNAIAEVINAIALSRCDVSFFLHRNDTEAASYPACGELLERIRQLHGPDYAQQLYPFAMDAPNFRVSGYLGAPDYSRINRTGQRFFVNGRPVVSPALHAALSRAYDEFMEPRRFPVAVLMLEIDSAHVDVNVHPTKREVRIRNERQLTDALVTSLRSRLRETGFLFDRRPLSRPAQPTALSGIPSLNALRHAVSDCAAAYGPRPFAGRERPRQPVPFENDPAPQPRQSCLETQPAFPFGISRILGQMHAAYLLAEAADGLVIIDQHAAHERILFEQLCVSQTGRTPPTQLCAVPVTLHLSSAELNRLEDCLEDLQAAGFELHTLGGGTISIDRIPVCLQDCDVHRVLLDTLHGLEEKAATRLVASRREQTAAVLACKTRAIKAGKPLSPAEMDYLVLQLGACTNPHTCPHGRPTFYLMRLQELERRLKRS
jgi:DNA mismatch repair protein MutL